MQRLGVRAEKPKVCEWKLRPDGASQIIIKSQRRSVFRYGCGTTGLGPSLFVHIRIPAPPPYVIFVSTSCPPDVTHVMDETRPSPFFVLFRFCKLKNKNGGGLGTRLTWLHIWLIPRVHWATESGKRASSFPYRQPGADCYWKYGFWLKIAYSSYKPCRPEKLHKTTLHQNFALLKLSMAHQPYTPGCTPTHQCTWYWRM